MIPRNRLFPLALFCSFGYLSSFEMQITNQNAEAVLVPLYTLLVILYLSLIGLQNNVESFFLPPHIRRKRRKEKKTLAVPIAVTQTTDAASHQVEDQPVDLSGAYKLVSNKNFDKFLEVQGVPWALRRAANSARPTHRIFHNGTSLTIKIEGIIESQTSYTINGPPVETNVRGRIFSDQVKYISDGDKKGIVVTKTALTENYNVSVQRELLDNGNITMTSIATFHDSRDPITCTQQFHRIE